MFAEKMDILTTAIKAFFEAKGLAEGYSVLVAKVSESLGTWQAPDFKTLAKWPELVEEADSLLLRTKIFCDRRQGINELF